MIDDLPVRLDAALQKLAKWRSVFAGWQLGSRESSDPECQAVRDHRELSMLMRAELSALTALMLKAGVCTLEELQQQILEEVQALDVSYEQRFPGMSSSEHGIAYDLARLREHGTMDGWKP